jgi:DNA replication protein DnaC
VDLKCTTQANECEHCHKDSETLVGICIGLPEQSKLCPNCAKQYHEYIKIKTRKLRLGIVGNYTKKLEAIIPPLFINARLNHLGNKFKNSLLSYNKISGCVLCGPAGTGKSYSICALLRFLAVIKENSNKTFHRISYELLCMKIRDSFKSTSDKSEYELILPYIQYDFLAIEDLGSTRPIGSIESEFSLRIFYAILDVRLENFRPTFITTNKTIENLRDSFDERIASRLSCMTWLGVGGKDKRRNKE